MHAESLPHRGVVTIAFTFASLLLSTALGSIFRPENDCIGNPSLCSATEVCIQVPGHGNVCFPAGSAGSICYAGDIFSPCQLPLQCIDSLCANKIVERGQSCSDAGGIVCTHGLKCIDGFCHSTNGGVGSLCSRQSYNLCERDLICVGSIKYERCAEKQSCSSNSDCGTNLRCVDFECVPQIVQGEACALSGDCRDGLICALNDNGWDGKCAPELTQGSVCMLNQGFRQFVGECGDGLTCQTDPQAVKNNLFVTTFCLA